MNKDTGLIAAAVILSGLINRPAYDVVNSDELVTEALRLLAELESALLAKDIE